jgi:hypothetical protein
LSAIVNVGSPSTSEPIWGESTRMPPPPPPTEVPPVIVTSFNVSELQVRSTRSPSHVCTMVAPLPLIVTEASIAMSP